MKKKPNVIWYYEECFRCNVYCIYSADYDDFQKYVKKKFKINVVDDNCPFMGRAMCVESEHGGYYYFIVLKKLDNSCWALSTLMHECIHTAHYILKHSLINHCEETEELYAYLPESIYRVILEKFREKQKRRKKRLDKRKKNVIL